VQPDHPLVVVSESVPESVPAVSLVDGSTAGVVAIVGVGVASGVVGDGVDESGHEHHE